MTTSPLDTDLPTASSPEPEVTPVGDVAVPQIDGYEIVGRLGEGANGVVWRAVQLGTRQQVALKLLHHSALGSEKARLRFEREVELAASLNHPNIARVYDSGLHQGLRFYAMELVEGVPLDQYVRDQNLSQHALLALMQTICEAVQHAHQRGVIHRDLKPSNILVTENGQPHVLDFGLAKLYEAGEQDLVVSVTGDIAGTPAYMSPEQVSGQVDQVDTRSDVYSLGVIFYRLLTGAYPRDMSGGLHEVYRRIATEEVKRPREVTKDVDKELEALLLKALAHDRELRYASAGDLGRDIDNYLSNEPLAAKPNSAVYFLRKRAAKYKMPVAITALITAGLLLSGVYSYSRVARARTTAIQEAAKAKAFAQTVKDILTSIDPEKAKGNEVTVREILDEYASKVFEDPEVEAGVRHMMGTTYLAIGRYSDAESQLKKAVEIRRGLFDHDNRELLESEVELAKALRETRRFVEAEQLARRLLNVSRTRFGDEDALTIKTMTMLTLALNGQGKAEQAETLIRQVVAVRERMNGLEDVDTLTSRQISAFVLRDGGKYREAARLGQETLEIRRRTLGEEHPATLGSMHTLASILTVAGQLGKAEALYRRALKLRARILGQEHADTLVTLNDLAYVLFALGKLNEAEQYYRETLEVSRRVRRPDHPHRVTLMIGLAGVLNAQEKLDEAEVHYRTALSLRLKTLAEDDEDVLDLMDVLASVLSGQGKLSEAEAYYRHTYETRMRVLGAFHGLTRSSLNNLALVLGYQGRKQEAIELIDDFENLPGESSPSQ